MEMSLRIGQMEEQGIEEFRSVMEGFEAEDCGETDITRNLAATAVEAKMHNTYQEMRRMSSNN